MAADKKTSNNALMMTLLKGRTFIVLIVLLIFFSITANNFLTVGSLLTVAKHVALYGILAIGMTYVIITGGIDLSVGSVAGLAGMIAGGLIQEGLTLKFAGVTVYFSVPLVVLITILMGALVGALNGVVITKFNVAPFIATLGSMYICRGLANIRSNGATFSELAGHEGLGNTGFEFFWKKLYGNHDSCRCYHSCYCSCDRRTDPEENTFRMACAGNRRNERLPSFGIKVDRVKIWVYAFSGLCSAIVGIIATSQLVSATPKTGESWEMNAIAASVLGGTSMAGGVGSIGGTIVGAFVIGVINDGMTMCGVTEFWQKIIRGLVIIVAVIIDQFQRNLQAKMALQARNENK